MSRARSGPSGGWAPVRVTAWRWGKRSSHPSGRAGRARVSCGARGLNQVGGRPVVGEARHHASSPERAHRAVVGGAACCGARRVMRASLSVALVAAAAR